MSAFTPVQLEDAAKNMAATHQTGQLVAAIVAGSGISLAIPGWERRADVPYTEVFPFPLPTLPGHTPTVTIWRKGDKGLLAFNGRFHLYQGYSAAQVAALPRMAGLLGAPVYIATNAAGSLDPAITPGNLVVIRDHINLQATSPLLGEWGRWRPPLFTDMTKTYDAELRTRAALHATTAGFSPSEGVYTAVLGAQFETPAEIEMMRRMGGTVVGMSTVQEVIAARHLGMRILVLSLVTNLAAGLSGQPLSHEEVLIIGKQASGKLEKLLHLLVDDLASE